MTEEISKIFDSTSGNQAVEFVIKANLRAIGVSTANIEGTEPPLSKQNSFGFNTVTNTQVPQETMTPPTPVTPVQPQVQPQAQVQVAQQTAVVEPTVTPEVQTQTPVAETPVTSAPVTQETPVQTNNLTPETPAVPETPVVPEQNNLVNETEQLEDLSVRDIKPATYSDTIEDIPVETANLDSLNTPLVPQEEKPVVPKVEEKKEEEVVPMEMPKMEEPINTTEAVTDNDALFDLNNQSPVTTPIEETQSTPVVEAPVQDNPAVGTMAAQEEKPVPAPVEEVTAPSTDMGIPETLATPTQEVVDPTLEILKETGEPEKEVVADTPFTEPTVALNDGMNIDHPNVTGEDKIVLENPASQETTITNEISDLPVMDTPVVEEPVADNNIDIPTMDKEEAVVEGLEPPQMELPKIDDVVEEVKEEPVDTLNSVKTDVFNNEVLAKLDKIKVDIDELIDVVKNSIVANKQENVVAAEVPLMDEPSVEQVPVSEELKGYTPLNETPVLTTQEPQLEVPTNNMDTNLKVENVEEVPMVDDTPIQGKFI